MTIPENYSLPTASEKKGYDLLPEDLYNVQITSLELKENQPIYNSTETEDKFAFEFTITEDGDYKGRKLWLDVRTVLSGGGNGFSPSWLYKIFCAVNNVTLNDEDAKTVSVNSINEMLGKEVRLIVKQKVNTKGVLKNKIENVLALKTAPTTTPATPSLEYNSSEEDFNTEDIPF